MSSITVPAKRTLLDQNVAMVILAGGCGRRMRSFGSKSLLEIDNKPLILHQIDAARSKFNLRMDIIVVAGYECDKVSKILPSFARIVENERFEETTPARSAFIGVRACSYEQIMIVYGDLFFNEKIFDICENRTAVLIDNNGQIKKDKIGVVNNGGNITYFGYDIDTKWGQTVYLKGKDIELFKKICIETKQEISLAEVFNRMINKGTNFAAIQPPGIILKEIDSIKDL